jgi:DNA-directed RNA polymerase subunit alpha
MVHLNQFNIKKVNQSAGTATFEIGPLPKGYGHTLGNFLRRVLLSSIAGSAITAVKIDGVNHEYSTMNGLPDDILAILLSLKNVVVVSKTLDPVTVELTASAKEGEVVEVKAGDIQKNSDIEIINPEYVITKLSGKNAKLKAQITISRGTGYAFANEDLRKEISVLPVDAIFSPVKLVNYDISSARVGQETELDQLNITIQTNKAVTPVEALHVATDILNQMTTHLVELSEKMLSGNEVTVELNKIEKENVPSVLGGDSEKKPALKVADMNLSTRLTNALLKSGYDDLRKLEGLTEEELSNIRGMGNKSFIELLDIVKKHSIKLI